MQVHIVHQFLNWFDTFVLIKHNTDVFNKNILYSSLYVLRMPDSLLALSVGGFI
jgi:hypothetical protein